MKRLYLHIISLLFICLFGAGQAAAQQAGTQLERNQIVLGEQVKLKLSLSGVDKGSMQIAEWFSIPDTGNHIEVIKREKIDSAEAGNNAYNITQEVIITSFDSGRWNIPIAAPILQDYSGMRYPTTMDSVVLMVNPVDVSHMQDFHDIKEVTDTEYRDYTWLYYLGAILLALLLLWIIIRYLKNRKKKPVRTSVIKGPPLQWALKEIDALQQQNLIQQNKELEYFSRLDDICRTYYDERTHTNTQFLTAREIYNRFQKYLQQEKHRLSLLELNKMNDVVKFARYKPSQEQADKAADMARETLNGIEQEINKQTQNNNQNTKGK